MTQKTPPTPLSPHGWEDEVFADFVAGAAQDASHGEEESSPRQKDALKKALAELAAANEQGLTEPTSRARGEGTGSVSSYSVQSNVDCDSIHPAELGTIECPELAEAFIDDAARGLGALDQAVINYESDANRDQALGEILRELHTLKGAAAVVGLTDTARYLHDVEDFVQESEASPEIITDTLLDCLDMLGRQVAKLSQPPKAETQGEASEPSVCEVQAGFEASPEDSSSISVKGEQLDRLLDMLTALTMLNNQRESHVDQLHDIFANLAQCSHRIRDLERILTKTDGDDQPAAVLRCAGNPLREVSNDLAEIGNLVLAAYSPIKQEHAAVSNFIRQFRHALVEILRMPVSGMFRRLQRSALDAARVERKQVRLEVIGSDAGLERSVQERLLDPLMHIVRNAVSHGIEPADIRLKKGKDPVGTITLEAISAPNLLTLTVRDDGQGLNYEALRRRGAELGLLKDGREPSREELGRLVFHRGFSTRPKANEIAGRGVGMDVVADTLEKLHAWVEIESVPDAGTTIKLIVPLKSITEHALIFRVGDHMAAVPMQYVRSADDVPDSSDGTCPQLAQALGVSPSSQATTVVSLDQNQHAVNASATPKPVSFCVDEIVGPQEVVVRPLPPLLRHQKLLAGVTLSTDGRVVYVLEPRQLAASLSAIDHGQVSIPEVGPATKTSSEAIKILVVDDSLSARASIHRLCEELGWECFEAADGIRGLESLGKEDWTAVITDFDMPNLDGIQFVEALRANSFTKDVPVLMVTSRPQRDLEAAALAAGATHCISKPLTVERLLQLIDEHCDRTLVGASND